MENKWWKNSVVYQIYPKSFLDSNGDGIGDLNGITERMDYIASLGVDVVWLCPVFRSPMDDNGYDISDYYNIDPLFGTNKDMDRLLAEAKAHGIRVLLDLVVNHCSDEHVWFQKAKKDPCCEEAGYFYFRTTSGGKEPNNWRSAFGGSVWNRLPDGRWYYHTFSPKQPDLNWENPKLRREVYRIIEHWMQKGAAGFRVDAITFIKKDLSFRSRTPEKDGRYPVENLTNLTGIGEFLEEMRTEVFEKYNCMTVAEAPGVNTESFRRYAGNNGYFSMIFDFDWDDMEEESDKSSLAAVERWKEKIFRSQLFTSTNGWPAVFLENHDQTRCVNKFLEPKDRGFFSASALATVYFFLYGTPFIYQGQEIGMTNAVWNSADEMDDVRVRRALEEIADSTEPPEKLLKRLSVLSRDHARTPMQWNAGRNAGFSTGTPWLKVQENRAEINVQKEEKDPSSLLSYYKKLVYLRRHADCSYIFREGAFEPLTKVPRGVIAYRRFVGDASVYVLVNFTDTHKEAALPGGICLLSNYPESASDGCVMTLKPYQAVVFYRARGTTPDIEKGDFR